MFGKIDVGHFTSDSATLLVPTTEVRSWASRT